jgi:hypothetical protein
MSWDVALVRIRGDYRPIAEVEEADYVPLDMPAAVRKAIRAAFPKAEWSGTDRAVYCGKDFEIELDLEGVESANTVVLHIHGTGDPIPALLNLTNSNGWLAVDGSTGEFIDPQNPSHSGWEGFKALVARSEERDKNPSDRLLEEQAENPAPAKWSLSGVERGPNDRYVYMQFLPGESPKKLRDAVLRHWANLTQKHGELAGISGPFFVLTLPDGEPFGDFWIRWYPALITETWEQFVPRVQEGAELLHAYAAGTGRRSGEIENGLDFVCDDGQRIPLAECTYHKFQTDAEYARKVKGKKNR